MTVREILHIGHPDLRAPAEPVDPDGVATADVQALIDDLIDTMRHANGAGIAATQVGVGLRVAVIEVRAPNPRYPYKPAIPLTVVVNPVVDLLDDERFANYEGCLSVPDLRGIVARGTNVRVRALDRHGQPTEQIVSGLSAGTFQHELDHLDGKLFVDRVTDTRTMCTWAEYDRWHREAFEIRARELVAHHGS